MKLKRILENELIQGSIHTLLGNGVSRVVMLVGTLLVSNFLGVEDFGRFSITRSTINVVLVIAGLNISTIITKTIAENKGVNNLKLSRQVTLNYAIILLLTCSTGSLMFVFSKTLSIFLVETVSLSYDFKLSSLIVVFAVVYSLNEAVLRGLESYKQLGLYQILSSLVLCVMMPLGARFYGVTGALTGLFLYSIFYALFSFYKILRIAFDLNITLFTTTDWRKEYKELRSFTLPLFISSLIEAPIFWLTQVILIKNAGVGANGIANALVQTRNLVLILPGYVGLVVLPILSKNIGNESIYHKNFINALKINCLIAVICTIPLMIFPRFFLGIYGNDFLNNYKYIDSFLCYLSIPIVILSNLYHHQYIARSKGGHVLKITALWASFFLVSSYVLCSHWKFGVFGWMLSFFLTVIFQLALRYYYAK